MSVVIFFSGWWHSAASLFPRGHWPSPSSVALRQRPGLRNLLRLLFRLSSRKSGSGVWRTLEASRHYANGRLGSCLLGRHPISSASVRVRKLSGSSRAESCFPGAITGVARGGALALAERDRPQPAFRRERHLARGARPRTPTCRVSVGGRMRAWSDHRPPIEDATIEAIQSHLSVTLKSLNSYRRSNSPFSDPPAVGIGD